MLIEYSMNGVVTPRDGNRQRGYLQGVYPTAVDGAWVAISVCDDVGLDHDALASDHNHGLTPFSCPHPGRKCTALANP